jgi:hypothetical protein
MKHRWLFKEGRRRQEITPPWPKAACGKWPTHFRGAGFFESAFRAETIGPGPRCRSESSVAPTSLPSRACILTASWCSEAHYLTWPSGRLSFGKQLRFSTASSGGDVQSRNADRSKSREICACANSRCACACRNGHADSKIETTSQLRRVRR